MYNFTILTLINENHEENMHRDTDIYIIYINHMYIVCITYTYYL